MREFLGGKIMEITEENLRELSTYLGEINEPRRTA
jgi:hypothetical protein